MRIWTRFSRRRQRERDIEREIQNHLDLEAEESGEQSARRAFGNVTLVTEDVRAVWGWTRVEQCMRDVLKDVRYSGRGLAREKSFALTTVATVTVSDFILLTVRNSLTVKDCTGTTATVMPTTPSALASIAGRCLKRRRSWAFRMSFTFMIGRLPCFLFSCEPSMRLTRNSRRLGQC